MEILKGTTTKVRNTVEINGGGNNSQVTTIHVVIFELDGKPVKIKARETPIINDGDTVAVAGTSKGGLFEAYAYCNRSKGIKGNSGYIIMFIFGIILPVGGMFALKQFADPFFGIFPKIIGGIFICSGIYMFYVGIRVLRAVKLLDNQPY